MKASTSASASARSKTRRWSRVTSARCGAWWWPVPATCADTGVPKHPRDLQQHDCVRQSGSARQLSFHEDGKVFTVPVHGSLRCNHVPTVVDACVAGLGCGVLMSYQVDAMLKAGKLKAVLEASSRRRDR